MDHVLTLVAARDALAAADVAAARDALVAAGATLGETVRLAPETACDVGFAGASPAAAEDVVRRALEGRPVDVAAQPRSGRRKRLLLADLESTVIENEMLDELVALAGVGEEVAAITARAMNDELDFAGSLRARLALLAGRPATLLERARERVVVTPGARELVATLRGDGVATVLVSGGFHTFADDVAARLGFDHVAANRLEVVAGRITGRAVEPILDRDAKRRVLDEHCARLGVGRERAAAVGDGANDLAMLEAAGFGVAYRAKPAVAAAARWRIDHGDLGTLLFYLGYRRSDQARIGRSV